MSYHSPRTIHSSPRTVTMPSTYTNKIVELRSTLVQITAELTAYKMKSAADVGRLRDIYEGCRLVSCRVPLLPEDPQVGLGVGGEILPLDTGEEINTAVLVDQILNFLAAMAQTMAARGRTIKEVSVELGQSEDPLNMGKEAGAMPAAIEPHAALRGLPAVMDHILKEEADLFLVARAGVGALQVNTLPLTPPSLEEIAPQEDSTDSDLEEKEEPTTRPAAPEKGGQEKPKVTPRGGFHRRR